MVNHDPYPWARFPDEGHGGARSSSNNNGFLYWNPREQFETDDPMPWRYINNPDIRYATRLDAPLPHKAVFEPRPHSMR